MGIYNWDIDKLYEMKINLINKKKSKLIMKWICIGFGINNRTDNWRRRWTIYKSESIEYKEENGSKRLSKCYITLL